MNDFPDSAQWTGIGLNPVRYDMQFSKIEPPTVGGQKGMPRGVLGEVIAAATRGYPDDTKVKQIPVEIEAIIGRSRVSVAELMAADPGKLLRLDKQFGEPLELRVNGRIIGYGELVADEHDNVIGIRMTEVRR